MANYRTQDSLKDDYLRDLFAPLPREKKQLLCLNMLRYPATAISLTMAEVKDYEQRRRHGDHFITPVQQSRIQHEDFQMHPARPLLCASPVLIRGNDIRHHADTVSQVDARTLITDSSPQFVLAHRPRMPTRDDEPGDPEGRILQSSAGRFQRLGQATDILDQSDNVANISPIRLPPPFSMGMRVVSDKHTMPTVSARYRMEKAKKS